MSKTTYPTNTNLVAFALMKHLTEKLDDGIVTLTFKKADGTIRTITGTANLSYIPTSKHPKSGEIAHRKTAATIYSFEDEGFRSFRWDSILSF